MSALDEFAEILTPEQPLAPLTGLGLGGPAQWLARPRTVDELGRLVQRCGAAGLPVRLLGRGSNVLVPDEGVRGVVVRLQAPAFDHFEVVGQRVKAGAGLDLAELVHRTCAASLSGLEVLAGIPGTIGGALRGNAGGRSGDIGQFVHAVDVMNDAGEPSVRLRADLRFGYRQSNLDDLILLGAAFELVADDPEVTVRRLKKIWIAKKAEQPFAFQRSAYAFRNPRGLSAAELIDRAELRAARVGGVELCVRDPRYLIAQPGANSRDAARLIDMVIHQVLVRTGVDLDVQIVRW